MTMNCDVLQFGVKYLMCRNALCALAISLAGLLCADDTAPKALFSQPLKERPLPPLVQVEINQSPVSMILDTGTSNVVVLDPSIDGKIQQSGKSESFTVAGGLKVDAQVGFLPMVKFGASQIQGPRVIQIDLQPFRDFMGIDCYGIVPMSFARGKMLQFDFDASVVQLVDRKVVGLSDWSVLPLEMHDGCPCIRLKLFSEEILFLIDTGFNSTCEIPVELLAGLVKRGQIVINPVDGKGVDAAGSAEGDTSGWFKKGQLMGKPLEGVEFNTTHGGAKFGMAWLMGFNFMIDLDGSKFYYKTRTVRRSPIAVELMVGAVFRYTNAGLVVERLRPGGGAAELAGLQVGDVIKRLGTDPTMRLDGPNVYDLVERSAGKKLPCIYQRVGRAEPGSTEIEVGKSESTWNFGGYRQN